MMESEKAKDIASLALSRIVLAVSFQDSETRYSSKVRDILQGETLKRFLLALDDIVRNVARTQPILRYGVCDFVTADTLQLGRGLCRSDSVDLIVTSPPYGNANDYHLYHRFRLLWLGYDPRQLANKEIGSHLRHQKESTGFDAYIEEMKQCLSGMYRVLKPGRYAVLPLDQPGVAAGKQMTRAMAGRRGYGEVARSVEKRLQAKRSDLVLR